VIATDTAGVTPQTPAQIASALAAAINADLDAGFTATAAGGS
jgi:phage tail sheath gpL-like